MFYLFGKRVFWVTLLASLCTMYSFGQELIWSTFNVPGTRTIPVSSVQSEIMRIFDQHDWHFFDARPDVGYVLRRDDFRHVQTLLQSFPMQNHPTARIQQQERRHIIAALDSHENFALAFRGVILSNVTIGGVQSMELMPAIRITIASGNIVMVVSFTNTEPALGAGYITNQHNRRELQEDINYLLAGFSQTQAPQAQRSPPIPSPPPRNTSGNPADHPDIQTVLQQVAVKIIMERDINQDGLINCIDAALWFYYLFPDRNRVRIMRNTNERTGFNHLFNAVNINGRWYNIEPQTGWIRRASMWMPYVWGDRYDTRYSVDRTSYWRNHIRRTQW